MNVMALGTNVITNLLLIAGLAIGCAPKDRAAGKSGGYVTVAKDPRRDPDKARKLNDEAVELIGKDKLVKAEEKLKKALEADVTFGPAHNNLGKVYYHLGDYYRSAWEFQYAAKLMPYQPEPRNNLGLVFESTGKLDEAIAAFDTARQMEPDNPQYIGNSVRARYRRGDRDEQVRQLLQRLIEIDTRPQWTDWARETLASLPDTSATQPYDAGF